MKGKITVTLDREVVEKLTDFIYDNTRGINDENRVAIQAAYAILRLAREDYAVHP